MEKHGWGYPLIVSIHLNPKIFYRSYMQISAEYISQLELSHTRSCELGITGPPCLQIRMFLFVLVTLAKDLRENRG
jgi:hypothetical protein